MKFKIYGLIVISLLSIITSLEIFRMSEAAQVETVDVSPGYIQTIVFNLEKGDKFKGSLSVAGGSGNDVNFMVKDPDGDPIIPDRRVAEGWNFEFNANSNGAYTLYFDNSFSVFSSKQVSISYDIEKPALGGGCLIATAAFGSELAPQIQMLRETRDHIVMHTQSGAAFMTAFNSVYYSFAPTVADWERQNPIFKEVVKTTIMPLITTLSILNYVDIDSEAEMIGYGIGVILLNIGMYFVAPVAVIWKLRSKFQN